MSTTLWLVLLSLVLVLKDKKSGLEALAVKQSLLECGTMIRCCHSAVQMGDAVKKHADVAYALWEPSDADFDGS